MAERTIKKYFCDICGEETTVQKVNYPVIFHTEQDEGRPVKPYISQKMIDMCQDCLLKALRIDGYGAQGNNEYELIKKRDGGLNE